MVSGITCIVTLHSIGFQQPPLHGVPGYADRPGYADDLHTNLCAALNKDGKVLLSDDPDRREDQYGDSVPIYVQSAWPPNSDCREDGIKRLGSWVDNSRAIISYDETQKLVKGNEGIAHVALVYSQPQEQNPAGVFLTPDTAFLGLSAYVSSLARILFLDMQVPTSRGTAQVTPSLRVRIDSGFFRQDKPINTNLSPSSLLAITRQLEDDIASYVCRNSLRESVRSFVLDALTRLACRDDVAGMVINAHSNGSVIAFDVLRQLAPFAFSKIKAFVTTGSPLRKYVNLFNWGRQIESTRTDDRWINFWDQRDPIADPLVPPQSWHRGSERWSAQESPLIYRVDPTRGVSSPIFIQDLVVDNVRNSQGGGLQAHNYWDNKKEFVQPLASLLKELVTSQDFALS